MLALIITTVIFNARKIKSSSELEMAVDTTEIQPKSAERLENSPMMNESEAKELFIDQAPEPGLSFSTVSRHHQNSEENFLSPISSISSRSYSSSAPLHPVYPSLTSPLPNFENELGPIDPIGYNYTPPHYFNGNDMIDTIPKATLATPTNALMLSESTVIPLPLSGVSHRIT